MSDLDPSAGSHPTPAALLQRAQQGDRASFDEVYASVAPALAAWARIRVRGRLEHHVGAEDVVQEVWVRAWQVLAKFDPVACSFRAWLFRVAKNVLYEVLDHVRRHAPPAVDATGTEKLAVLARAPAEVTAVSQQVARSEAVDRLVAYLDDLPEDDRRLVMHCGLEELTLAQTGAQMGLTRDAVAKRWRRLRARVRDSRDLRALIAGPDHR